MNFSMLNMISDGDKDFISDFISTFETTTIPQIGQMFQAFQNQDFDTLGRLAHQVKPTAELLGMSSHADIVMLNDQPDAATQAQLEAITNEANEVLSALKEEFLV